MKLSKSSVDFAINHVAAFYDSDFFPKPVEFESIWALREEVVSHLTNSDLTELPTRTPTVMVAPKPAGGFRVVHQLDPLNSLVYTALVHTVADHVEQARTRREERVACSYRIQMNSRGGFFSSGSGYREYYEQCDELSLAHEYVLLTDLTDFYNQVNLHRLNNNIASCDRELPPVAKAIEDFLSAINANVSKGIPVGPAASIIMAEAVLIDVDNYILAKQPTYTRYVDDMRIFAHSKRELIRLLAGLTKYLYDNHRLTLSSSKTKILSSETFRKEYLKSEDALQRNDMHENLETLTIKVPTFYPEIEAKNLTDVNAGTKNIRTQAAALQKAMNTIMKMEQLDLGLARHVLRRSRKLRSRTILQTVLQHLERLAPVMPDVILYLLEITNRKAVAYFEVDFEKMLRVPTTDLPFVKLWLEHFISTKPWLLESAAFRTFLTTQCSIRSQALVAARTGNVPWVRDHKNNLGNYGPWDRRAIVYAARVLPHDERNPWLDLVVAQSSDILEKWVARHTKSLA